MAAPELKHTLGSANTPTAEDSLDERYIRAIYAISEFAHALWDIYGGDNEKPLHFYIRLIDGVKKTCEDKNPNNQAINRCLSGFRTFAAEKKNETALMNGKLSEIRGEKIYYGDTNDKFYIDISRFIKKSADNQSVLDAIRAHILTISALIDGDIKKMEKCEKIVNTLTAEDISSFIDGDTEEDKAVARVITGLSKLNIDPRDPQMAILDMFSNPDLVGSMQNIFVDGQKSGKLKPKKLAKTVARAMAKLAEAMPEGGDDDGLDD